MDFVEKKSIFFIKTNIQANQTGPIFAKFKYKIQFGPLNTFQIQNFGLKRDIADSKKMYEKLPIVLVVYEQM